MYVFLLIRLGDPAAIHDWQKNDFIQSDKNIKNKGLAVCQV